MSSFHCGVYKRILATCLIFLTLFSFTFQSLAGPRFSRPKADWDTVPLEMLSTRLLTPDSDPMKETCFEGDNLASRPLFLLDKKEGDNDLSSTTEISGEADLMGASQRLQKTEETYRHWARLSSLSSLANRILYSSFLRKSQELSSEDNASSRSRLWIYGESTFLKKERALQKVYGWDAFLEGNITVLMEGVDLAFKVLLITQVFYSITEHPTRLLTVFSLKPLPYPKRSSVL